MTSSLNKIHCGVVVTYFPNHQGLERLISELRAAKVHIILVNNGGAIDIDKSDLCYLDQTSNTGIATAQNIGVRRAIELGADVITFFDQDSIIKSAELGMLCETLEEFDVQICAPIHMDEKHGFVYPVVKVNKLGFRKKLFPNIGSKPFFTNVVISSGLTVRSSIFQKVGYFLDEFFIDYVDTEWCLRADYLGIKILVNPAVCLRHSIGDRSIKILSWRIPVHSPLRRYFRIRNSIHLIRMRHFPIVSALREILFSNIHTFLIATFTKRSRTEYLKFHFRALWDGVNGKFGGL